jgi:hypothetical protein
MGEQVCRYCQNSFPPSKFQPAQAACGDPEYQRRRRNDYHRRKIATDPIYRQVCLDSVQQWRAEHPDYWAQLRERNPSASGAKPAAAAPKRPATATTPSCQQQLSFASCQQQPSYPANS